MAVRRILRIDDEADNKVLKSRCRPVRLPNPELRQLVDDLFETMEAAEGVAQCLAVIGIRREQQGQEPQLERYVLVNPTIVKISQERETILDGCLSLPGWYGEVARAAWVTVDYQDLQGGHRRLRRATGLLSWALQHEIDHLNGVLFTEHIRDLSTLKFYGPRGGGR
jgi:peptide deformylase